jgi:hypothetical protein
MRVGSAELEGRKEGREGKRDGEGLFQAAAVFTLRPFLPPAFPYT